MSPQPMRSIALKRHNDTKVDCYLNEMATSKILSKYKKNKNVPSVKDVNQVIRNQTNKGKYALVLNNFDGKDIDYFEELKHKFRLDKSRINPNRLKTYIKKSLSENSTKKFQLTGSGIFAISNLIDFILGNAVKILFSHHTKKFASLKKQQRSLPSSIGTITLNNSNMIYLGENDIKLCSEEESSFNKILNLSSY